MSPATPISAATAPAACRSRARSTSSICKPEYQGLGFGRRLFKDARKELASAGFEGLAIWALADNDPAVGFYRALGGQAVARSSETFGGRTLEKIAFGWGG